jgi:hypothetical protein
MGIELRVHGIIPVLTTLGLRGSWTRTARLRRDSEAALDYLSGQVGGVELRELLAHAESMETDQPELDSGT